MSTFEHKNSLRTIEAQIVQKVKNNEARPKCTGSYKKSVYIKTVAELEPDRVGTRSNNIYLHQFFIEFVFYKF